MQKPPLGLCKSHSQLIRPQFVKKEIDPEYSSQGKTIIEEPFQRKKPLLKSLDFKNAQTPKMKNQIKENFLCVQKRSRSNLENSSSFRNTIVSQAIRPQDVRKKMKIIKYSTIT